MFRRSLCALTVVTFAACTDDRSSMLDSHSDTGTDSTGQGDPLTADSSASPTESMEGVGPGLIIIETGPAAESAAGSDPSATPPATGATQDMK